MEHRDEAAALRFLKKALRRHGVPKQTTIDNHRGLNEASPQQAAGYHREDHFL
jgi:transposase-like protein